MEVGQLLKQLDVEREAFLRTSVQLTEAIAQSQIAPKADRRDRQGSRDDNHLPVSPTLGLPVPNVFSHRRSPSASSPVPQPVDKDSISDDSDEDDDESYYVQEPLPSKTFDHEDLRKHISTYKFDQHGREILASLHEHSGRLNRPSLFDKHPGWVEHGARYSHYQIFDVGVDGAPLQVNAVPREGEHDLGNSAWLALKDINSNADRERKAVGRITVAREPSSVLFAALHLTLHDSIDMDELFRHLVGTEMSSGMMHGTFQDDPRRQRTFVFNFEYYTIVAKESEPMRWQQSDQQREYSESQIRLSRCSAIVGLCLYGDPIKKIRNPARRAKMRHGNVFDPWAPWHVVNIQCYPDYRSRTDTHDSTKHYVNGPEAFLHTLLSEYRDAQRRFEDIYKRISKLITPPPNFIFNDDLRDKRLFEDKEFTFTRRYFWAHQTLGTMNDSIKSMIDAYQDNLTENVWLGKHKSIWPLLDEHSPRNENWKRRLAHLRRDFEREIERLHDLITENNERREEIRSLRDQLFSGTSVLESRRTVELSEITIQQGYNIKLLTLVNMIFVPLTFVTSIFGMTNMPTKHQFYVFAIVLVTVCVPFFILVGTLNTTKGYGFMKDKWKTFFKFISRKKLEEDGSSLSRHRSMSVERSNTAREGLEMRLGRGSTGTDGNGQAPESNAHQVPPRTKEVPQAIDIEEKTESSASESRGSVGLQPTTPHSENAVRGSATVMS